MENCDSPQDQWQLWIHRKRDVRPGHIATGLRRHGGSGVLTWILSKTEGGIPDKRGDANTDPDSGTIPAENIRLTYPVLHSTTWIRILCGRKITCFLTVRFSGRCSWLLVFLFSEKRPETKGTGTGKKNKRKKGELRNMTKKKSLAAFFYSTQATMRRTGRLDHPWQ